MKEFAGRHHLDRTHLDRRHFTVGNRNASHDPTWRRAQSSSFQIPLLCIDFFSAH